MKKRCLPFFAVLISAIASSQIGIGTNQPHESAILHLESNDKALLVSKIQNVSIIDNPQNGMIAYDITDDCIKFYQDDKWTPCIEPKNNLSIK